MARDLTAMPSSMIGTIVWSRYVLIGRFQTAESRAAAPGGSAAGGPGSGAAGLGAAGLGAGAAGGGGAAGAAGAVVAAGGASMSLESTGLVGASGARERCCSDPWCPVREFSDEVATLYTESGAKGARLELCAC